MDRLTIAISPCEDNPTCGGIYFLVEASVNGVPLPDYLDVDELFLSLTTVRETAFAKATKTKPPSKKTRAMASAASARLPIFNCSCGVFDCGGYYVDATLTREVLVWESTFVHCSQEAGCSQRRYAFSWENVHDVAGELVVAIASAAMQYPEGEVASGVTSVNLVERLPSYRERYEFLGRILMSQANGDKPQR